MSTRERDPIFEALDRLAGVADGDPVGDRMPDIRRRVRVARRRKATGLVAAAVVLAAGGVGVQQALPDDSLAPPVVTTPDAAPWQRITVEAQPEGVDRLRISFSVTGRSTAYADGITGRPIEYAGPQSTEVAVDGEVVSGSDGGAIACEPGGALTSYTERFHTDQPLVVPVSSPGEHTVVVKAPYCADGELVESTETVVVTTEGAALGTAQRIRADLDGDGADEVVSLLWPADVNGEGNQVLRVTWGTGETTEARLPNDVESDLPDPVDLDDDGDLELVVGAGGGDLSLYRVFLAGSDGLEQVRVSAGADGERGLRADTDTSAWQTYLGEDGFSEYRFADPDVQKLPAEVEVRRWSLSGRTLSLSEDSATACASFQPVFSLGPC